MKAMEYFLVLVTGGQLKCVLGKGKGRLGKTLSTMPFEAETVERGEE